MDQIRTCEEIVPDDFNYYDKIETMSKILETLKIAPDAQMLNSVHIFLLQEWNKNKDNQWYCTNITRFLELTTQLQRSVPPPASPVPPPPPPSVQTLDKNSLKESISEITISGLQEIIQMIQQDIPQKQKQEEQLNDK